jgi:cysteinyl-tRNA synthetase
MSRKELGQPVDIHCGGVDHISVHHENEIAQSECAYGVPYVNHWMHVEFLTVEGQKMSKSLGNAFTLDDLRGGGIDPRALRLFFLGAHYRSKQNFTWEAIKGAESAFVRLERIVRTWSAPTNGIASLEEKFRNALLDDMNTPAALAVIWETVESEHGDSAKASSLLFMDRVLGLGLEHIISKPLLIPSDIQELAKQRFRAREAKDWAESDRLRDQMSEQGWIVQDTKDGYRVERLPTTDHRP